MDVNELIRAGSDILGDVMTAVETNQYSDLGSRISGRIYEATAYMNSVEAGLKDKNNKPGDKTVYSGTVENTNRRDGVYRTNFAGTNQAYSSGARAFARGAAAAGAAVGAAGKAFGQAVSSAAENAAKNRAGNAPGAQAYRPEGKAPNNTGYYAANGGAKNIHYSHVNYMGSGTQFKPNPTNVHASKEYYTVPGYSNVGKTPFLMKRVGTGTGIAQMILTAIGGLWSGVFSIASTAVLGSYLAAGDVSHSIAGLFITAFAYVITGLFGKGFYNGALKHRLSVDYYRYGQALGHAEYFSISDLAKRLGLNAKKLKKDILRMMKFGFLPFARMDERQETVMLTDRAFGQYMQAVESGRARELEADRIRKEEEEKRKAAQAAGGKEDSTSAVLRDGRAYIKKVREYNDLIPDDREMSNKLYRLESITNRIFEQVEKNPASADDLRKFMEYYLPTTEKLLSAYVELDKQNVEGENIVNTRQEIEAVMDTINDAYERLLDSMFEEMAWDVTSDISVMKTMMAQDGLMEKEMSAEKVGKAGVELKL